MRLAKLEHAISPKQDTRKPLLLKFIGYDDESIERAGILFVYHGRNAGTYNLSIQQQADYEASECKGTTEAWLSCLPRPARTVESEQVYKRKSSFRTGSV